MSNESKELNIKLIVLGDSNVGKTSLIHSYIYNTCLEDATPTVGLENKVKTIDLRGFKTKVQIWDTAGQEKFNSLTQQFFRNTDGIILVFDLTNKNSFNHIKDWIDKVKDKSDKRIKKIIVGNKSDIKDQIKVTQNDIDGLIKPKNMRYVETSAHNNENVEEVFDKLINSIVGKKTNEELIADHGITDQILSLSGSTLNNIPGENKKKCC